LKKENKRLKVIQLFLIYILNGIQKNEIKKEEKLSSNVEESIVKEEKQVIDLIDYAKYHLVNNGKVDRFSDLNQYQNLILESFFCSSYFFENNSFNSNLICFNSDLFRYNCLKFKKPYADDFGIYDSFQYEYSSYGLLVNSDKILLLDSFLHPFSQTKKLFSEIFGFLLISSGAVSLLFFLNP